MENLSMIFSRFDEPCARYELLIKVKLIDDVCMYVGGLFTREIQPAAQAEQIVQFGLDALADLEEINETLRRARRADRPQ
jgi:hypothetical protein